MTALLRVREAAVAFGGVRAVDGVSCAVEAGELVGLIGPNGAGKTTLLKLIAGMTRPDAGTIVFDGREVTRDPLHRRARQGLAVSRQIVQPFRAMTLRENVAFAAGGALTRSPLKALLALDRRAALAEATEILARLGIADAADGLPGQAPLGVLKRLEVARALALRPKLMLLDEPLAGLNSAEAARLADLIAALNRDGTTILLIEHNLGEVLRICRRLLVLDQGKLLAEGDPQAVMAQPAVRAAYMGEVSDAAA